MQTPLQLTFRNVPQSDALEAHLRARAHRLARLFGGIVSAHVVVELAGHHHGRAARFRFCVHVGLPGHPIMVTRAPAEDHEPESAYATADRAFDEAERQIEDWVRRGRGQRHAARAAEIGK